MSKTEIEYTNKVLVELKNNSNYKTKREIYVFYVKDAFRIFESRESFESFVNMVDLAKSYWQAEVIEV